MASQLNDEFPRLDIDSENEKSMSNVGEWTGYNPRVKRGPVVELWLKTRAHTRWLITRGRSAPIQAWQIPFHQDPDLPWESSPIAMEARRRHEEAHQEPK
jgi:hypothetical protein